MIIDICLIIIAIYCIAVIIYILFTVFRLNITVTINKPQEPVKEPINTPIIGKTNTLTGQLKTLEDNRLKDIAEEKKVPIFAPTNEKEPTNSSGVIPNNKLDETFETEGKLELDVEGGELETVAPMTEEELANEEEDELRHLGVDPEQQAQAVLFDEMKFAYGVANSDNSTPKDKSKAGEVLLKLSGSDIEEQLRRASKKVDESVDKLIAFHIERYYKERQQESAVSNDVADFDILNFV